MRRFSIVIAVLLSCTAPPVTAASPSPTATVSPIPLPSATASPSPRPDLTIVPAGQINGDHALVLQETLQHQDGSLPTIYGFWDVPLDGTAPKQLLSYTRGDRLLIAADHFDFLRQRSPDGRQLVLADPVDVAGTGLLLVDLIAGTTRSIPTNGGADQPAWSPDGQRIAYRGYTGQFTAETGIWLVSAAGGSPHQVAPAAAAGGGPTWVYGWTEDGAGLAVGIDARSNTSVVEVATGTLTRIGGVAYGAAWRAKRPSVAIVFEDQPAPGTQAGHVEVRDTTFTQSTIVARFGSEGSALSEPRWNPRTDEILFHWQCGQGVTQRAELVVVDGASGKRRALPTSGCVRAAAWNSDGTKILYSDLPAIRVMNTDGSNDHELFAAASAVTAFAPR